MVRMASQLGNYDYLVDWVFNDAGEIDSRIGATGIDALKGVAAKTMRDPTAMEDTQYGTLVAPGLVAVQHDHYFNYRRDLDVDDSDNSFEKDIYRPVTLPPASSPRRSIYTVTPEIVATEGAVVGGEHGDHEGPMKLRVVNEAVTNAMGNPASYEIVYANHDHLIIDRDDTPAQRSAFLQADMWVTPYDENERFAGGDYLFAWRGVQGLPVRTRKERSVRNKDLVVWLNMACIISRGPKICPSCRWCGTASRSGRSTSMTAIRPSISEPNSPSRIGRRRTMRSSHLGARH
jgi:primary-amine oxidase